MPGAAILSLAHRHSNTAAGRRPGQKRSRLLAGLILALSFLRGQGLEAPLSSLPRHSLQCGVPPEMWRIGEVLPAQFASPTVHFSVNAVSQPRPVWAGTGHFSPTTPIGAVRPDR